MSISETVKTNSGLSDAKRALLEKRLCGRDIGKGNGAIKEADGRLPTLVPDALGRYQPFSFLPYQEQLWKATRATGITPWFYFETQRSGLDLDRFEQAWHALVARHDMLRAVILAQGAQKVLEQVPEFTIARQDLSDLSPGEQERRIEAVRAEMLRQPRRQDQWPLFDVRVSRLAQDQHMLHFGFDMLLFDLASIELIAADCKYIYHDETSRLKPLEIGFRDLVLGERQFSTVAEARRSDRYWRERFPLLPEAMDVTDMPLKSGRPQFVHHHSILEREQWQKIKEVAREHGITGSMVVFGAFNEVLSAYGGRQHYALESRVFRRLPLHKNILDVAGQFVAGIVSEVDVRGKSTFLERCQVLERQVWRDLENGYVDAARLWHEHRAVPPETPAIVYTSTVARFENFVQFGAEPPMKWFGREVFSCYQMPNLGIEFYLVESAGTLESHWFLNDALFAEGKSARMFADYDGLLKVLATEEDAWQGGLSALGTTPAAVCRG